MKAYCFVAQPFDEDMFDDRYMDIIEPVVNSCGLECYRVDRDSSVDNLVSCIEERIAKACIVIAEITMDNPNVWYELGYASALGKPIVMLCSDERSPPYPFDIRHRKVLAYRTKSPKDFDRYRQALHNAITSRYHNVTEENKVQSLTDEELLILKFIARDQKSIHAITPEEKILKSSLDRDKVLDCLKVLMNNGYLEYNYSTQGQDSYYHVTAKAEELLFGR